MEEEKVLVNTTYGPILGYKRTSFMGDRFYSFRGIPYAKPPVGELRFKDPQPPNPWTTPLDVTQSPNVAVFIDQYGDNVGNLNPASSEDCLLLNVYTKNLDVNEKYPVMVWIHGGAFKSSSCSEHMTGPDYLLQKDVILVSITYRLGAFGFLSIKDPSIGVPGNAGLKDQTLALKWIRNNIENFGGDSKNVTIFGCSAGGCSVHFHMISDHSRGLFDKAISQSGTALSKWANHPKNNSTERLATKLGWTGEENDDLSLYEFLKTVSTADIVKTQDLIHTPDERKTGYNSFGPSQEYYLSEQCFFIKDPWELCRAPWSNEIPLIIGGVADEGLMLYRQMKKSNAIQSREECDYERVINFIFEKLERGSEQSIRMANTLKDVYLKNYDTTKSTTDGDNLKDCFSIWGDAVFWYGIWSSVQFRLENPQTIASTYLYRFDLDSTVFNKKKLQLLGEYVRGCSHADETLYLFKNAYVKELPSISKEYVNMQRVIDMWTEFAKTGDPNSSVLLKRITYWKGLLGPDSGFYGLNISDDLSFIELPESERLIVWHSLFDEYTNYLNSQK